ncbi:hypothetical protein FO059_18195 (plasmid) [Tomitella fengzijianii]|uniref:Uncharacterized protein n=1 Tax=Tomitella fengzijianii TaxID=2597660 RepID=A0A516X8X7_9ACTN|nr:hypothetical protein FO059_18195 [Tomitella fengzijianii]
MPHVRVGVIAHALVRLGGHCHLDPVGAIGPPGGEIAARAAHRRLAERGVGVVVGEQRRRSRHRVERSAVTSGPPGKPLAQRLGGDRVRVGPVHLRDGRRRGGRHRRHGAGRQRRRLRHRRRRGRGRRGGGDRRGLPHLRRGRSTARRGVRILARAGPAARHGRRGRGEDQCRGHGTPASTSTHRLSIHCLSAWSGPKRIARTVAGGV